MPKISKLVTVQVPANVMYSHLKNKDSFQEAIMREIEPKINKAMFAVIEDIPNIRYGEMMKYWGTENKIIYDFHAIGETTQINVQLETSMVMDQANTRSALMNTINELKAFERGFLIGKGALSLK